MKFHRVIGKIPQEKVDRCAQLLSKVFLDLCLNPEKKTTGTQIGGDPLIFSLVYPAQHILTESIATAATDGRRYYWNPDFLLARNTLGLRFLAGHEAWHAMFMHPKRRGGRNPKLWNWAVDYIVDYALMKDLESRGLNPSELFLKNLGNFATLDMIKEKIKDPFKPMPGSESWLPDIHYDHTLENMPAPDTERELTKEEKRAIKKKSKRITHFFADPNLPEDMRRPENIYNMLYSLLPKCPDCGALGRYKIPDEWKKKHPKPESADHDHDEHDEQDNKDDKNAQTDPKKKPEKKAAKDKSKPQANGPGKDEDYNFPQHSHKPGQEPSDKEDQSASGKSSPQDENNEGEEQQSQSDSGDQEGEDGDQEGNGSGKKSCSHGCGTCGKGSNGNGPPEYYDIFDLGDTLDEHMDADETPEESAKRLAEAIMAAKKCAGAIPAGLEDEIGELISPIIRWQDVIKAQIVRAQNGNARNDWTRFKSRPLAAGLMIPKRIGQHAKFAVLLDTSGSMSRDDMAFGVSQLQALDEKAEGTLICGDAQIYYEDAIKLKRFNPETLSEIVVRGRGGTHFTQFFDEYEQYVGKVDFIIMITDGFLMESELVGMNDPGVPVYWLITSGAQFEAPFGRVFDLK